MQFIRQKGTNTYVIGHFDGENYFKLADFEGPLASHPSLQFMIDGETVYELTDEMNYDASDFQRLFFDIRVLEN